MSSIESETSSGSEPIDDTVDNHNTSDAVTDISPNSDGKIMKKMLRQGKGLYASESMNSIVAERIFCENSKCLYT